jgi:isopenicillin-N epimerase
LQKRATRALAHHWTLDPEITFLNHGSFGACPKPVLARQAELRAQLEREPVRFFNREGPPLYEAAREAVGRFVGADARDLAFVPNVTTAINSVLRSLPLSPGDELVVSTHQYNAVRNAVEYVAAERGAKLVVAHVPFPVASPVEVAEAWLEQVNERTRLVVLDHVTSQTGLVQPLERLLRELDARGVDTLVDGAHAPGMLPLDVRALAPAYYTGNCHKWLCAPKGAGFIYVRPDLQDSVRPANISHGANSGKRGNERFRLEFDWIGTGDPTAQLCVPTAIEFMAGLLPGGWDEVRETNRSLCLAGRRVVAEALGVDLPCPDEMIGSLASLPVPVTDDFPLVEASSALVEDPLYAALYDRFGIQAPVLTVPAWDGRLIRISSQLYNHIEDYEYLADALRQLLQHA